MLEIHHVLIWLRNLWYIAVIHTGHYQNGIDDITLLIFSDWKYVQFGDEKVEPFVNYIMALILNINILFKL
jgi:hypothetical protein